MSPSNDGEASIPQQYGCLNKTWKRTTATDMPVWEGKIYEKIVTAERESLSSPGMGLPGGYPTPSGSPVVFNNL